MSEFIRSVFAQVAKQASEEMSNNGCNDFPVVDDLESLLAQLDKGKIWFQDWMILDLLVQKLKAGNV